MADKERLRKALKSAGKTEGPAQRYLSTGSTLLNLATSGNWRGGLLTGSYYFFVGDSSSGKTFLTLTCFAEATRNKRFSDYSLIYDNVENGALMDFASFFGTAVADRVSPPKGTKEEPIYSQTIDDFYFHLSDALKAGPCIYVLDSMDALSSDYEYKKFEERKKAAEDGGTARGHYGDGKAKANSAGLRACLPELRDTGSILIIINQTRDNINAGLFESKKTRSGGHALSFYAALEIWSSVGGKVKKAVKGKDRVLGIISKLQVKKNRLTGKLRTVDVPILYEYGIDDVGGCVDFLLAEGQWKAKAGIISATGLTEEPLSLRRFPLIKYIEENGLEDDLRLLVNETWDQVEAACKLGRKKRYE